LPKRECRELLQAARNQDRHCFADLVEKLCGLEPEATLKLLASSAGEEPLYLIRALGVTPPHDLQMALMIQPRFGRSIENYRSAKKTLSELNPGICRIIFNEIGAGFDLGTPKKNNPDSTIRDKTEPASDGFREALNERRRSVVDTRSAPATNDVPIRRLNTENIAGLAPMTRWPGSETGLRDAV